MLFKARRSSDKLQLGCFDQPHDGWLNTDITPHIFLSRVPGLPFLCFKTGVIRKHRYEQHKDGIFRRVHYLDVRRRFPLPDAAFRYVFISHVLEHLFPEQARGCLQEIHRVLQPGGIVRVSVPDLDVQIAEVYNPADPDTFLEAFFNHSEGKRGHHWYYNEGSLAKLLTAVGFETTYRCRFRDGRCADVKTLDNRPRSLFMEAVK